MVGYISEYQYYGMADNEFIEVAVPTGTDVSSYSIVLYQGNGTIVESYSLGDLKTTINGQDVYVVDDSSAGMDAMHGAGEIYSDDAIALVDGSGNVVQFISHWDNTVTAVEGPAAGMTSTDVGTASSMGSSLQSDDGGNTYYVQNDTNKGTIPACYAPGSRIRSQKGETRVEDLKVGDFILTQENKLEEVCWIWCDDQPLDEAAPHQKPVLISKDAIANGIPNRDLVVSGQHRIAVGINGQLEHIFSQPAFVPAKALVDLPGIRLMHGKKTMTWYHFLCKEHSVVIANNLASESLLLQQPIVSSLSDQQRSEISSFLERIDVAGRYPDTILPTLKKRQAEEAIQRVKLKPKTRMAA